MHFAGFETLLINVWLASGAPENAPLPDNLMTHIFQEHIAIERVTDPSGKEMIVTVDGQDVPGSTTFMIAHRNVTKAQLRDFDGLVRLMNLSLIMPVENWKAWSASGVCPSTGYRYVVAVAPRFGSFRVVRVGARNLLCTTSSEKK